MNSKFALILVVAGCGAFFAGCGSKQTGTYTGNENVNSPGTAALSESSVSLNIQNEDGNNNVTGSFTDQAGTSSFSGTVSSDGTQIQNVSLAVPAQAAASTVNGIPSTGCGGTYTGSLSLSNGAISGSLTNTTPQTLTSTTGLTSSYPTSSLTNACSGATRVVSLNKSS